MRPSFFLSLVLAALLSAQAAAQPISRQWIVTPIGPGPDGTVTVLASLYEPAGPCFGDDCYPTNPCMVDAGHVYLSVDPCPEGETCGGILRIFPFGGPVTVSVTLTLRSGVAYDFYGADQYEIRNEEWVNGSPRCGPSGCGPCSYIFPRTRFIYEPPPTITFTDIGAGLPGNADNLVDWGDYDNDGDLDFLAGSSIYRNDGSGVFTDAGAGLPGSYLSSAAWGDYDNDGDLDVALMGGGGGGDPSTTNIASIYRNDGAGLFVDIVAGLQRAYHGAVEWGDYDNDGDLDLLLMGIIEPRGYLESFSAVYRNEGADHFTDIAAPIPGAGQSAAEWGDFDRDGDLDILMSGAGATGVYRNDGAGGFTNVDAGLPQLHFSAVAWGDYDNDGDLDILLTGSGPTSRVYRNDGSGVFADIHADLEPVYFGAVAWGDYDNDGDLDILLTGDTNSSPIARVYRNDAGAFVDAHAGLPGLDRARGAAWGDYDADGDLDILIGSRIFRSDGAPPNTRPWIPDGPWSVDVIGGDVTLTWSPSSDQQTAVQGLSYNLRVGTTPGGSEIVSAMADPVTGYRRVVQRGNAQQRTSWTFHLPEFGFFCWSVQAIDGAYAGSRFSPERFFGPVPIRITNAEIEAKSDRIEVSWYAAINPGAIRLYRRTAETDWTVLGTFTVDGSGYLRYADTAVQSGMHYGYRLGVIEGNEEVFVGETWATVPAPAFALDGVFPNPAVQDLTVTFSLPDASPVTLEVLNVSGRRVAVQDVGRLGPGRHVVHLGVEQRLPAGVYLLRLTRGTCSLSARAVVLR